MWVCNVLLNERISVCISTRVLFREDTRDSRLIRGALVLQRKLNISANLVFCLEWFSGPLGTTVGVLSLGLACPLVLALYLL